MLVGMTLAEITHTSKTENLRLPIGEFTQFRIAGEGVNDDNLRADITQTKYSVKVQGQKTNSRFGLLTDDKFDVFVFTREEDYNCYIEASTLWKHH